jgi:hypothetical protein
MSVMLGKHFKACVGKTYEDEFEDFIKDFYLILHGPEDFIPTRPKKDKGSDGNIVSKNVIIACYGPSVPTLKKFQKKVDEDYASYSTHWMEAYQNWYFIHNQVNSPDHIKHVQSKSSKANIFGLDQLESMFLDLPLFKQRKVGNILRIDEDLFSKNYFQKIIDDIAFEAEGNKGAIKYEQAIYIDDKIALNFSDSQIDEIKEQFEMSILLFPLIKEVLSEYDESNNLSQIKTKVLTDIGLIDGDCFKKINMLSHNYVSHFNYSEDFGFYIKSLLLYLFEQCLFGMKTAYEKEKS